jgi:hypothetical protein
MSVRATSQLMGAATAQHRKADATARIRVVTSGSIKSESIMRRAKLPSVSAPLWSVRL